VSIIQLLLCLDGFLNTSTPIRLTEMQAVLADLSADL